MRVFLFLCLLRLFALFCVFSLFYGFFKFFFLFSALSACFFCLLRLFPFTFACFERSPLSAAISKAFCCLLPFPISGRFPPSLFLNFSLRVSEKLLYSRLFRCLSKSTAVFFTFTPFSVLRIIKTAF